MHADNIVSQKKPIDLRSAASKPNIEVLNNYKLALLEVLVQPNHCYVEKFCLLVNSYLQKFLTDGIMINCVIR